jgi:uncharacterized protein YpuA (DUF1002 family)
MKAILYPLLGLIVLGLCFASAALGALVVAERFGQGAGTLGSAMENTFNELSTSNVNVGEDLSTLVVATNTARQYLRITNNSTSSAQALYCNTNDRAATKDLGLAVFASSSIEFDFDHLYRGALRCIFAIGTSSVTVVEK